MVTALPSSYKDPDGFVFKSGKTYFRQINNSYKKDYDACMHSGLYEKLILEKLLIPHTEQQFKAINYPQAYKIIKPQQIPFVSYPYEWTFSQLKDAALTTLKIQSKALEYGMTLKDASAYNIQFYQGLSTFIDTLSFTKYLPDTPWTAYRQFCEHFLGPLALMSKCDLRLEQLLRTYLDGVPLSLTHRLLPFSSYLSLPLLMHIHLHNRAQSRPSTQKLNKKTIFPLSSLRGLIDSLTQAISQLNLKSTTTIWSHYYEENSYTNKSFEHKINSVSRWLSIVKPKTVWDLGANQGVFSRLASQQRILTIAFDNDPDASEANYRQTKKTGDQYLLPLVMDLTNPSPQLGFAHGERLSLVQRGPADLVLALALLHHLAISHNLPFAKIAEFFSTISKNLIIEFVPKQDVMIQQMLSSRADIFASYSQEAFETAFNKYFVLIEKQKLKNSHRILYLLRKK